MKSNIRMVNLKGIEKASRKLSSQIGDLRNKNIERLESQIAELRLSEESLNRRAVSLERRNIRLAELNKLKDEFIAVASHQLRTPATGVKQYIDLLLEGYADPLSDNQKWFLERANESNIRQLRIIDDLLQVARIDSGSFRLEKAKTDVTALIRSVLSELAEKFKDKQQKVSFKSPAKPVILKADPARLRMVFENLIDNAINYSFPHKKISVELSENQKSIMFVVKDEGVGINKADFSKLFQKFSRLPNPLSVEVGGTGLGLYWASKIVKLHGGDINVESQLNKGSRFIVKIPK